METFSERGLPAASFYKKNLYQKSGVTLVTSLKRYFFALLIFLGCCGFGHKAYAFDYQSYAKQTKQIRSVEKGGGKVMQGGDTSTQRRGSGKESIAKVIIGKILSTLDSDTVPAKMFKANRKFSIYFKPAKVTKIGVRYKF